MTLALGGAQLDGRPWHCIPLPFGSRFIRLCPYSICFLDVYLVCHGDGLETKRQPLWTNVRVSESMRFRTRVYWTFFSCMVGNSTSQNIQHFLNTLYVSSLGNLKFRDSRNREKN